MAWGGPQQKTVKPTVILLGGRLGLGGGWIPAHMSYYNICNRFAVRLPAGRQPPMPERNKSWSWESTWGPARKI